MYFLLIRVLATTCMWPLIENTTGESMLCVLLM